MKKIIIILSLVTCHLSLFSQEQYPYQYTRNNGSIQLNIGGYTDVWDGKMIEVRDIVSKAVLDVPFESTNDFSKVMIRDIPAGIYNFNVKYAPQGNNIWCTACSKSRNIEVINDSKYICINTPQNEK